MKTYMQTIGMIAVVAVFHTATVRAQSVKSEVKAMYAQARSAQPEIVTEADLEGLPEPVQHYLRAAGIVGRERIRVVRLKQTGSMRMAPDKPWLPMRAVQYYTTDPPAFIWRGSIRAAPLFRVVARDRYSGGRGNMRIKLLGLFKVADARAPELDQGTLVRFLSEGIWFPTVYLEDYIRWEAIDSVSARATMSYGDVTAAAVFTFDEAGRLTNFVADRYMDDKGSYRLERWSTPIDEYGEWNGLLLPVAGEAIWHLESGEFSYIKVEITDLEYGIPEPY